MTGSGAEGGSGARRGMALHTRMLIGFGVGVVGGLVAHALFAGDPALATFLTYVARPVGKIFLRLLFMLVVPLIFSALVLGITGLGDLRHLGHAFGHHFLVHETKPP